MKVKDIMTSEVCFVLPNTKITEVAKVIFEKKFHGVPVLDEGGEIVGIITETDFFTKDSSNLFLPSYISFLRDSKLIDDLPEDKKIQIEKLLAAEAKDIMTPECVTILEDMSVNNLLDFFKDTKFTTLPVVNSDDKMVGIVTLADIIGLIKV